MEWLPYARQSLDEADIDAVVRVLRSDFLTTGPEVEAFERVLAEREGVAHAVCVNSGTAALHAAYAAAGVGAGTEVLTSPLTFAATTNVALALGATPRFADIDPQTGTLDPAATEAALTAATRLIVPVDYGGLPADYVALSRVAARAGVALVADACHSLGARSAGRSVAAQCDGAALSFHPVKPITTGEGGAFLTENAEWAERARRFRNHGIVRDPEAQRSHGNFYYEVCDLGLNYRLPDILCALGRSQIHKLSHFLGRRSDIATRYLDAWSAIPTLECPVVPAGVEPGWHLFVLRVRDASRRRVFFEWLESRGLGVQLHYRLVYEHPLYRDRGYPSGLCPAAEDFSARALSVPLFPGMTEGDVDRVIDLVAEGAAKLL